MVSPLAANTAALIADHSVQCPPCVAGAIFIGGLLIEGCSESGHVTPPGPHTPINPSTAEVSDSGYPAVPSFTEPDSVDSDSAADSVDGDNETTDKNITPENDSPFFFAPSTFAIADCSAAPGITSVTSNAAQTKLFGSCADTSTGESQFWSFDPVNDNAPNLLLTSANTHVAHLALRNDNQAFVTGTLPSPASHDFLGSIGLQASSAGPAVTLSWPSDDGEATIKAIQLGGLVNQQQNVWITVPGEIERCIDLGDLGEHCEPANEQSYSVAIDVTNTEGTGLHVVPMLQNGTRAIIATERTLEGATTALVVACGTGSVTGRQGAPWLTDGACTLIDPSVYDTIETRIATPPTAGSFGAIAEHNGMILLGSRTSKVYGIDLNQEILPEFDQLIEPAYSEGRTTAVSNHHISAVAFVADGAFAIGADSHTSTLEAWTVTNGRISGWPLPNHHAQLGSENHDDPRPITMGVVRQSNDVEILCAAQGATVYCFGIHPDAEL